jgi:hypothetical protein
LFAMLSTVVFFLHVATFSKSLRAFICRYLAHSTLK